jgi:hypothetical protein
MAPSAFHQSTTEPPDNPDHQGAAPIGGWHLFRSVGGTFFDLPKSCIYPKELKAPKPPRPPRRRTNRWVAPFSIRGWHLFRSLPHSTKAPPNPQTTQTTKAPHQSVGGTFFDRWVAPFSIGGWHLFRSVGGTFFDLPKSCIYPKELKAPKPPRPPRRRTNRWVAPFSIPWCSHRAVRKLFFEPR